MYCRQRDRRADARRDRPSPPGRDPAPESASGRPHDIAEKISRLGITAVTARPGWQFTPHHASEQIQRQWQAKTAGGFGFADDDPAVFAAAAVLSYLEETQKTGLAHLGLCGGTWSKID